MREVRVIKPYRRPYENPIAVAKGDLVTPDFDKATDIEGWVWCTAEDGRSGWTPKAWLESSNDTWRITRDFNAIELTVAPGDKLELLTEESNFLWVRNQTGDLGWVPRDNVSEDL